MDINIVREVATVVSFLTFLGILFYAVHPKTKPGFEEASRMVLDDDDAPALSPMPCRGRLEDHE